MRNKDLTRIAMIAAIYTAVSLALAPFSYGNIQVRIAEALTLLPLIYQPSIAGLTIGCFLTNVIGVMIGANPTGMIDAFVGTTATLLAAIMTFRLKDIKIGTLPIPSILMPVLFNMVFVGIELGVLFFPDNVLMGSLICGMEVAAGELISVILGWFLIRFLDRSGIFKKA